MSRDTSCLKKPFDKHSRNSHKLKFSMKSWTFSYSTFDLTDSLFMRYFTKRKLIQNLLFTKLIKFDFQYLYVSLDVQVKYQLTSVDISYCSFKELILLLVGKLLEL